MLPGVGIIGTGRLVTFLVPCLRAKGFSVEAIWSLNLEEGKETSCRLEIPFATDSVDELLLRKEVQLIVVACPPHLHATIVSKAFSIGKHVVCGWPASLSSSEMREMVERATYYPTLISILAHPLRFVGAVRKLKQLIDDSSDNKPISGVPLISGMTISGNGSLISNSSSVPLISNSSSVPLMNGKNSSKERPTSSLIGPIKLIEVNIGGDKLSTLGDLYTIKCDQNMGGGLLTNVGSHIIDTITFITGLRAKRVNGTLRTFAPTPSKSNPISRVTIDDYCSFQMELDTPTIPMCTNPTAQPQSILVSVVMNANMIGIYSHEIKVIGSKGYLLIKGSSLYCYKYSNINNRNSPTKINTQSPNKSHYQDNFKVNTDGAEEQLIFEETDETLNALNLNSNLPSPYDQGMVKLISTLSNAFRDQSENSSGNHHNPCLVSPCVINPCVINPCVINQPSLHHLEVGAMMPDSSYSSATSSLNSAPECEGTVLKSSSSSTVNSGEDKEGPSINYWVKDAVSSAASFEDGEYIQAVIEAVKLSNEKKEWIRVKYNHPFGPMSPARKPRAGKQQ